jgi:hypothetical protein
MAGQKPRQNVEVNRQLVFEAEDAAFAAAAFDELKRKREKRQKRQYGEGGKEQCAMRCAALQRAAMLVKPTFASSIFFAGPFHT